MSVPNLAAWNRSVKDNEDWLILHYPGLTRCFVAWEAGKESQPFVAIYYECGPNGKTTRPQDKLPIPGGQDIPIRNFDVLSILESEQSAVHREKPIKDKTQAQFLDKCAHDLAVQLAGRSNISAVSPCGHMIRGTKRIEEACLVVYVHHKGVIPWNPDPKHSGELPKTFESTGVGIDVRQERWMDL